MTIGGGRESGSTTKDPWSEQVPYLKDIFAGAQENYQKNPTPTYYPYSTVAEGSPESKQAASLTAQRALSGSPLVNQAKSGLSDTIGGSYLYSNPIFNTTSRIASGGVTNPAMNTAGLLSGNNPAAGNPAMGLLGNTASGAYLNSNPHLDQTFDRAAGKVNSAVASQFSGAGRYGSGLHQANTTEALSGLANDIYGGNYARERQNQEAATSNLGNLYSSGIGQQLQATGLLGDLANTGVSQRLQASGLLGNAYDAERGRQQQGIFGSTDLANQDYTDLQKLMDVGQYKTDRAQTFLDEDINRYYYNQDAPQTALENYMRLIQGDYGGTTNSKQSSLGFNLNLLK
jgi:hypothetical protein